VGSVGGCAHVCGAFCGEPGGVVGSPVGAFVVAAPGNGGGREWDGGEFLSRGVCGSGCGGGVCVVAGDGG